MLDLALPAQDQPNLAEAKPLERYLDSSGKPQKPFQQWVKTMTQELEQLEAKEWEELSLLWMLINFFVEGKQMLVQNHRTGAWTVVPMPKTTTANIREQNKLGFYFRVLLSKWVASDTKVDAIPGDDTDQAIEAAKVAQQWWEALKPFIFTEKFNQQESVAAPVHGTYARYAYFDPEAEEGGYAERPITETQDFGGGESLGECFDCEHVAPAAEFGAGIDPGLGGGATPSESNPADMGPMAGSMLPGSRPSAPPTGGGLDAGLQRGPETGSGYAQSADGMPGDQGFVRQDIDPASADVSRICPACGSSNVSIAPAVSEPIEIVTGTEKHKLGQLKGLSVPYSQLRHEMASSLEDSEWVRWKRRLRTEKIKAKWPKLEIPPPDSRQRDPGLAYEDAARHSVGMNRAANAQTVQRNARFYSDLTIWWLTPCMYAEYVFPADLVTVEGDTIAAGTEAIDAFPDGMVITMVEGVDAPLQLKNEAHKTRWVTAPYHLRLFTGLGLGIQDAVEMQRQWNLVLSLVFTQIRTGALGGWLYDKDAIEPDHVRKLGQPQMSVPVSLRNRPEGTRIEQLVKQMDPGQIPAHIPWYITQLDANMQTSAGALVNEGLPGVDSKTATGTQAMVGASAQHNAPEFALKGDADARFVKLLFDLAKKHYIEPRYLPFTGKRGKQGGIWLSAADFENGQIRWEAVRDSAQPHTRADKQNAIKELLLVMGGIQGLMMAMQTMPEFVEQTSEAFSVDIQGDLFEPVAIICRQRMEAIQELAPTYAEMLPEMEMLGQLDPMSFVDEFTGMPIAPVDALAQEIVSQIKPKVETEDPAHPIAIKYLRDMFFDDDIKEADDLTRACLKALIRQHVMAGAKEQMVTGAVAEVGQPPVPPEEQGSVPGGPQQNTKPQEPPADARKKQAQANMKPPVQAMNPQPQMGM